ncbi:hypothetical protein [Metabacillus fastidiosus]|uniref:ATP-dependent DNA ligase n=1 Tax=Metabacillus fastidiosus TaxID=1458 RepID=UPI003D2C969E
MSQEYPLDFLLLPMGSTTVKDSKKMDEIWESDQYIAERKWEGSRYLSVGGRFFSRRVSNVTAFPVEKTAQVPHLNDVLKKYPLLILDGEVYIKDGKSNEVVSIMECVSAKAIERQVKRGNLKYMVYDILRDTDGNWLTDLPWIDRRGILEEQMEMILTDQPSTKLDIFLSVYVATNKKEFNAEIMRCGGAGVLLKNINGRYLPDKKPRWNWIKVKQDITSDVIITGFKPAVKYYKWKNLEKEDRLWSYWENPRGILEYTPMKVDDAPLGYVPVTKYHFYGWIGAVVFAQYNDQDELVQVGHCSELKEELRVNMSENSVNYIGECMEVSSMKGTKDGYFKNPSFLRMRPDKNPKDCVIGMD